MAQATLHRLRGWLPIDRSAKCLDLGCGAGHLMCALREAGYSKVRGIDVSPESVSIAQGKGLDVLQTDLCTFLGGAHQRFDVICAFDVLEHFRKDELLDVLDLIHQSLAPGGVLLIQVPNAVSPWASDHRYGDLTHELIFSPECAASILRLTGFGDIEVREVGPFAHGMKSALRWGIWQLIRAFCAIWNLSETGGLCGGIYSRNMMLKAIKAEIQP